MARKRLKFEELDISNKRYKELCGFCEQYPEWKDKLEDQTYIEGVKYDSDPKPSNHENSDSTAKRALKLLKLKRNVEMVEKCAKKAGYIQENYNISHHIIRSACYEDSYEYLNGVKNLHISRTTFYEHRRYFFYLLDIEKNKE